MRGHPDIEVEVCVGDAVSAERAAASGATRIELCDRLDLGGTTPSADLTETVLRVAAKSGRSPVPVRAMVRPRGGHFAFTHDEIAEMKRSAARFGALHVDLGESRTACGDVHAQGLVLGRFWFVEGIVTGVLTAAGSVDVEATRSIFQSFAEARRRAVAALITADTAEAAAMGTVAVGCERFPTCTFHRAIDECPDPDRLWSNWLERAVETGCGTILTSGTGASCTDARSMPHLRRAVDLCTRARGSAPVSIMAGAGVRSAHDASRLVTEVRCAAVHGTFRGPDGLASPGLVSSIVAAVRSLEPQCRT